MVIQQVRHFCRVLIVCFFTTVLLAACGGSAAPPPPPPPTPTPTPTPTIGQVEGSDWRVRKVVQHVYASVDSLNPLTHIVGTNWHNMWMNGYAETDKAGCGQLRKTPCSCYFFQRFNQWQFGVDTLSSCSSQGSATCTTTSISCTSCAGVKLVTRPAWITHKGTLSTVVDAAPQDLVLILVHEGEVEVVPTDEAYSPFTIPPGMAAYVVGPGTDPAAFEAEPYSLPHATPFRMDDEGLFNLVDSLGTLPQLQRANAIAYSQQAAVYPHRGRPFVLAFRGFEGIYGTGRGEVIAQGLAQAIDWGQLRYESSWEVSFFFDDELSEGDPFAILLNGWLEDVGLVPVVNDFSYLDFDPVSGVETLKSVLYPEGFVDGVSPSLRIYYDGDTDDLTGWRADVIAGQLSAYGMPAIAMPLTDDNAGAAVDEVLSGGIPALVLGFH